MPSVPKGYKMFQFPTRGGQSADIYSKLATGVGGGLPDILQQLLAQAKGDPSAFQASEQLAMNQFQQQVAPQIAQRYAGSGLSGSSGMQNALAGAGGNLALQLQAQRQDPMQKSMQDVLGLGGLLLERPDVETQFMKKDENSFWNKLLGIGLPVAGAIGGGLFGGPMGAYAGGSAGAAAGRAFF